jgi:hypothetical protein
VQGLGATRVAIGHGLPVWLKERPHWGQLAPSAGRRRSGSCAPTPAVRETDIERQDSDPKQPLVLLSGNQTAGPLATTVKWDEPPPD